MTQIFVYQYMTLQNHTYRRAKVQDRSINREQKDH